MEGGLAFFVCKFSRVKNFSFKEENNDKTEVVYGRK